MIIIYPCFTTNNQEGFIIIKQTMGNNEFQVSGNIKQQWTEILQGQKRYLRNRITLEQFQFIVLSELKSDLYISSLIERSIYPLPKTPKIIILNGKEGELSVLVQRRKLTLKEVLCEVKLELQLFKIIRDIVAAFETLFRRFGPFGVNDRMLGGNSCSEVMVWINETFELCQIQTQLPKNDHTEQIMLSQIIKVITSSVACELSQDVFNSPPSSFSKFIAKIQQMISEERENILSLKKTIKDSSYLITSRHPNTRPQNMAQNKEANIIERIPHRKYNIPKFLKKNKTNGDHQNEGESKNGYSRNNMLVKNESIQEKDNMDQDSSSHKNSVGKVRSLHVSPSIKSSSKYTHSFATTNYSLLSQKQYPGTPQTLTYSKGSTTKELRFPSPQRASIKQEYRTNIHQVHRNQERCFLPFQSKSTKHLKAEVKNLYVKFNAQKEIPEKERIVHSYGSLNLHCRTLLQSKELCESQIEENIGNQQDYSMVIHNELQSFFGVQEEPQIKMDITEEFSRIIY